MRAVGIHLIACSLAAAAPLLPRSHAAPAETATPGAPFAWPARFEGRPLSELPLTGRDRRFADDFPGRIGRFSDGTREIILRTTTRATRRLHPASDCLAAIGFAIEPLPARRGPDGTTWGCVAARKALARGEPASFARRVPSREGSGTLPGFPTEIDLSVCEQIRDAAGHTWPDPSSWYWPALAGRSAGPWWSTTIVEREPAAH